MPVRIGGIGICSAAQLASYTFLSSSACTVHLVEHIFSESLKGTSAPEVQQAIVEWCKLSDASPPSSSSANHRQRAWDSRQVEFIYSKLVETAPTPRNHVKLLEATTKESGAWLNAHPSTFLELRLEDEVVRISIGLRLEASISFPHQCRLCGLDVDAIATHGFSCFKSEGRPS